MGVSSSVAGTVRCNAETAALEDHSDALSEYSNLPNTGADANAAEHDYTYDIDIDSLKSNSQLWL